MSIMTFSAEIQLILKAEFGLVSNVCNILGYLEMIIDLLVLEKIFKSCYLIWTWQPFLSCDLENSHFYVVSSNGYSMCN